MILPEAFGAWLLEQFADAARKRLGEWLLGSEQERALQAAGREAIVSAARELRPGESDKDVEQLAQVLDQVFGICVPADSIKEHPTMLQALQAGIAAQLAVLGDANLTEVGQSSAQVLDLSIEQITETLTRNVVQEILARGASGGALTPLTNQLNHDLTHLQNQHTVGILAQLVEELTRLTRQDASLKGIAKIAARTIPHELPRPVADFTGRVDELATLQEFLEISATDVNLPTVQQGRPTVIIAIHGMGGIGKSALAIQAAHRLVDVYPDGQLYVNLQGATPGLPPLKPLDALGHMLRALGLDPAAIPSEVEEAAARFRSLAAERRLLVLLDNAHTVKQIRPLLPASPTCGVLVTSRQILATLEGTQTLHLGVLLPQQALQLFGRIAGLQRITAEPQAAGEVVRWCGLLPLAIRIAGARLAARPTWNVRDLAERLADSTHRLQELQAGELAVYASFEMSLRDLRDSSASTDRAIATAFGLLSLPDGPDLSVAAAARLLNKPELISQRLLERLVDAQLLETPQPGRYQFHDLVRLYARNHAVREHSERKRLAALTRLFGFYAATAWQTLSLLRPGDPHLVTADPRWTRGGLQFHDEHGALTWLKAERTNLLTAVTQATTTPAPPPELPGQLTRALFGLFQLRSYLQDSVEANKTTLTHALRTQDRATQAYAHHDLGVAYRRLGQYARAISSHHAGLTLFRELGDRQGQAVSLNSLGVVYERMGRYAEAIAHGRESGAFFQELGDFWGKANSLNDLGLAYGRLRRYEEAMVCLLESQALFQKLGDRWGQANNLNNLGLFNRQLGRYEEAIARLLESQALFQKLGDHWGQAVSQNSLGVVYRQLEQHDKALECHQASLVLFRDLNDRHGEAAALRNLGDALRAIGRNQQAEVAWHESWVIFDALQIPEANEIRARLETLSDIASEPPADL